MKTIILHLIREDIKQTRFIQQLNNLGLSADEHLLNLSPVIFDLMELDRSTPEKADEVQERYQELVALVANASLYTDEQFYQLLAKSSCSKI